MRILLAEDNAIVRKAVAAGLLANGYEVDLAEDGEKAFTLAHTKLPDLIISDVLMPNMDGFSLCQAVRGDRELRNIPVVFYSSTFLDPEDEALAQEVGASGFILKDDDPETFRHKLHNIIESERQHKPPPYDSSPEHRGEANRMYRRTLISKLHKKISELGAEKLALHESRRFLDHIVTTIPDVVIVMRLPELELSYIAPQAERLLGYPGDELTGGKRNWRTLVDENDLQRVEHDLLHAVEKKGSTIITCRMQHKNGEMRWIEGRVSPRRDAAGKAMELVGSLADVTERFAAEEQLISSEQRFRNLFEMMESGMSVHELVYDDMGKAVDYRFLDVNPAFERLTGLRTEQVVGRTIREVLPGIEDEWISDYIKVAQSGVSANFIRYAAPLDRYYHVVAYQTHKDQFATVFTDVTEQRKAEEEIRNLARFPEENPNPVIRVAESGEILYLNPVGKELLAECGTCNAGLFDDLIARAKQALAGNAQERVEYTLGKRYFSFVITPFKESAYANLYGREITKRVVATQQLERTNRVLRTLSHGNRTMVHSTSEDELLHQVCEVLAKEGEYPYIWIAYSSDGKHLQPQVGSGEYAERMQSWMEELPHIDLTKRIFSGLLQDTDHLLIDPSQQSGWTKRQVAVARENELTALVLLPLRYRQDLLGMFGIFSARNDNIDETELSLLRELAGDIAYGIQAHRTHAAHEMSMRRIQSTMFQTIEAVSRTLEKRDPYTAGHQQRVMQLAVAIAREMGFPEQRIEGLRLAAQVHDIGKIHVPAEILNRPGRLTESEYGIIKSHPQVGYDILKDVEFDWPIADIVLQHHERCDGSGYPRGLKREQIVPEARILSVADVVEAITAHRPYRASLGIDVALGEIEKGRGKIYNEEVVDTCLRLFRERGFEWS